MFNEVASSDYEGGTTTSENVCRKRQFVADQK